MLPYFEKNATMLILGSVILNVLLFERQYRFMVASTTKRKLIKRKRERRQQYYKLLLDTVMAPIFLLLGCIVPKNKKLVLFMGRDNSGFLDNVKYLYTYLYENGIDKKYHIIYVGHNEIALSKIKEARFKCLNFPSLWTYWYLLRAELIITDNAHWTTHNRSNAAIRAKKVQLWHGIGFKKIRLSDEDFINKANSLKGFFTYKLQGRVTKYNTLLSTSQFFSDEVLIPSFYPDEVFIAGYPRNDVLFKNNFSNSHLRINADNETIRKISTVKREGKRIVLYAPTFRNAKQYNISREFMNWEQLSNFGNKNNIVFIFKLHPLPKYDIKFADYDNIYEYNSKADVYPLLPMIDLMITDYSSIYMDYLLIDKPIVFFYV